MKGAAIIVECLIEQGVEYVFGYPGGYIIDVFDELYKRKDRITQVLTCHEQGASHCADGYARASGKVGVVVATSGPGATNLVTGIATAYMDSVPMVAITGNVSLSNLGRDSFQEVDITGITMPITKHNYIVKDISELASTIRDAFVVAASGRPGPVLIDIPKDVQQADYDYSPLKLSSRKKLFVWDQSYDKIVDIVSRAARPLLYIGGGCITSKATDNLLRFIELTDCPFTSSLMGLGVLAADHPLNLGMVGMHGSKASSQAVAACDTLIVVGARFSDRVAGNREKFCTNSTIIHIDIDDAEIDKNVLSHHNITGDASLILGAINSRLTKTSRPEWVNTIKQFVAGSKQPSKQFLPQQIIESIARNAKSDSIVATDVGQHQMWVAQYYPFSLPRTLITSGGLGTMGFGLGASIGACLARKSRVVLVTGDGSFHMNLNELATASRLGLPIVIFLFNNNSLGMVRQWQRLFYAERYSSTTLDFPTDYALLAKAFGIQYYSIDMGEDYNATIKKALASNTPTLVNCIIDKAEGVFPIIPPGKSSDDMMLDFPSPKRRK